MRCERTTARFPVRHTAVAAADEATNATSSCNIPAWKVRIHSLGLQRLSLALAVHYPLASPIDLGESNVAGSRILLEQEEKKDWRRGLQHEACTLKQERACSCFGVHGLYWESDFSPPEFDCLPRLLLLLIILGYNLARRGS